MDGFAAQKTKLRKVRNYFTGVRKTEKRLTKGRLTKNYEGQRVSKETGRRERVPGETKLRGEKEKRQ